MNGEIFRLSGFVCGGNLATLLVAMLFSREFPGGNFRLYLRRPLSSGGKISVALHEPGAMLRKPKHVVGDKNLSIAIRSCPIPIVGYQARK